MNATFLHIWKYPMLLAVLTIFGLLAALTGSGIWHIFSWMSLAVPILVCIRFSMFTSPDK